MARTAATAAAVTAPTAVTFTAAVVVMTALPSLRGAQATKQSSLIPLLDCFAEPVIGPAMTGVFIPNLLG
jgi:hypothetical protein